MMFALPNNLGRKSTNVKYAVVLSTEPLHSEPQQSGSIDRVKLPMLYKVNMPRF